MPAEKQSRAAAFGVDPTATEGEPTIKAAKSGDGAKGSGKQNTKGDKGELMEKMWEYLDLIRIYTKPKGQIPDYEAPVIIPRK